MKKLVVLVGARPQFIKHAPLDKVLKKNFDVVLVHSGQHYDFNMSKIFFNSFGLSEPDHNLNVGSGTHSNQTNKMMVEFEKILLEEKPSGVIVYGDTNTTLAGAIATTKLNIPLVHIEAGLRSHNMNMPEEINRMVTDRISDILFCPSKIAVENLKNEGIKSFFSGDVMYDAFLLFKKGVEKRVDKRFKKIIQDKEFALLTIHRESNTKKNVLKRILKNVSNLNMRVIFPVHPRTKKILKTFKINRNIEPIDPVGYFETIYLLKKCSIVLTDSGGLQKEAYFARKFCVTLRSETEWVETVRNGYNILLPYGEKLDENIFKRFKPQKYKYFYGNGKASQYINFKLKELL